MHLSPSRARIAGWIALPVALLASGAVVATASYASFTASTENPDNSWTSGKVVLTDDRAGTAMFDVDGLAPGDADAACITVTSDSTVDSTVAMYTKDSSPADGLSDQLLMTVHSAPAGTDCADVTSAGTEEFAGPLSTLTSHAAHADGIARWDTGTTQDSRVVRIGYSLPTTADNTAQDTTASTTFVWEAISK